MEKDGKVHQNAGGRLCVGPEEERGAELRFRRGMGSQKEQAEKQYQDYMQYMIVTVSSVAQVAYQVTLSTGT